MRVSSRLCCGSEWDGETNLGYLVVIVDAVAYFVFVWSADMAGRFVEAPASKRTYSYSPGQICFLHHRRLPSLVFLRYLVPWISRRVTTCAVGMVWILAAV